MIIKFTATSRVSLMPNEQVKGKEMVTNTKHLGTEVILDVSSNLNRNVYFEKDADGHVHDGIPSAIGVKPLTIALVEGLLCNIHAAHERGYWDSAEHLRYIISSLEDGFVRVADVKNAMYGKGQ